MSRFVTFDFKPYARGEFLEVAQEVNTGQLGKDPVLEPYVAERAGPAYKRRPPGYPGDQAA